MMTKKLWATLTAGALTLSAWGVEEPEAGSNLGAALTAAETGAPTSSIGRPEFDLSIGVYSKYLCQGVVSNRDANLQESVSMSWYGVTAGVFGVTDMTDALGNRNHLEEIDYSIGYAYTFEDLPLIGKLSVGAGWVYCDLTHAPELDYQEFNAAVTLDDVLFSPSLSVNWNFEDDKWWARLSGNYETPVAFLDEKLSWSVGAELYWGNARWNEGMSGAYKNTFSSLVLTTGPAYKISENVTLNAYFTLAWAVDPEVRDNLRDSANNHAVNTLFGVSMSVHF